MIYKWEIIKNNKLEIELRFRKWNIHFHIFRLKGLEKIVTTKIDIIFYIDFGLGKLVDRISTYGLWFYIDLLRFNFEEDKKLFGFTIPIRRISDHDI